MGTTNRLTKWTEYVESAEALPVDVVALETVGNCNRSCEYCPVSVAPKRTGRMPDAMVYRVFDELGAARFRGKLTYHFYNEPMIDTRIYDFVAYSARKVPDATRHLTSNGDLLDRDAIEKLFDLGATIIVISAHDEETFVRFSEIKKTLDPARRLMIRPFFRVGDGTKAARITNRAGAIDLSKFEAEETVEARLEGCNRIELNVDYQGNVHPCCMDFSGGYILGNIEDSGLVDIWKRSRAHFRDHYFGGYSKEVCRKCAKLA